MRFSTEKDSAAFQSGIFRKTGISTKEQETGSEENRKNFSHHHKTSGLN